MNSEFVLVTFESSQRLLKNCDGYFCPRWRSLIELDNILIAKDLRKVKLIQK